MREDSVVKRSGSLRDWVAAVFAGGRALYNTEELQLMRNALAWEADKEREEREAALAQRTAQLQAELQASIMAQQASILAQTQRVAQLQAEMTAASAQAGGAAEPPRPRPTQ
jgi:hypothetical protein